jgi:NaMN:DMB phosphoribosyltransferase
LANPLATDALQAAIEVAARHGLAGAPIVLGASKNLTVLLAGTGTVARVTAAGRLASLERELAVAAHLAARNAPAVAAAEKVPPGPHVCGSHAVSFGGTPSPLPPLRLTMRLRPRAL